MSNLPDITNFLNDLLRTSAFSTDSSINGLQVESPNKAIKTVSVAVDSGLSIIEKAVQAKSDLLIVHHGLFWGETAPIVGTLAKKIALLMSGNCSLFASHLPLDANEVAGNGFEMARFLELEDIRGFCEYKGQLIGAKGRCASPKSIEYFTSRCSQLPGAIQAKVFSFGPKTINTVGIVTGSGSFAVSACAAENLDLLISGEPKHEVYHLAKEQNVNAIFAGHYATETFGVLALGRILEEKFKLKINFIDEGTGI